MKQVRRTFKDRLRRDMKDPVFRASFHEEDLPARLAVRIAELRQKQGLTQSDLARRLHITQQAMSRLERPATARYSIRTLQRLANVLNRQLVVEIR